MQSTESRKAGVLGSPLCHVTCGLALLLWFNFPWPDFSSYVNHIRVWTRSCHSKDPCVLPVCGLTRPSQTPASTGLGVETGESDLREVCCQCAKESQWKARATPQGTVNCPLPLYTSYWLQRVLPGPRDAAALLAVCRARYCGHSRRADQEAT